MGNIYRGDDTSAFGNKFLTIYLRNDIEREEIITKAIFKCGEVIKEFENPTFPLEVELTAEETLKLRNCNTAYFVVFDKDGKPKTCDGSLNFKTKEGVL